MVMTSLYDEILYEPEGKFRVEVVGKKFSEEPTTILRAAQVLSQSIGLPLRGRIRLLKRIPDRSGFGGGSGDAAGTLLVLVKAWAVRAKKRELQEMGRRVGSDVPFFFTPTGAAIVSGTGERVEPVRLQRLTMVLSRGKRGIETAHAFRLWDRRPSDVATDPKELADAINRGDAMRLRRLAVNAFQEIVASEAPEALELMETLNRCGAIVVVVTGSGSGVVGIFSDGPSARSAQARLEDLGFWAVVVHSLRRGISVMKANATWKR